MRADRIPALLVTRRTTLAAGAAGLLLSITGSLAQSPPAMLRLGWIGLLPRSSPIYTAFLKRMGELG
jgi:putative ABC transport system substrate-binding protein